MDSFRFKKLALKDLPLLHRWYNSDHVQAWYANGKLEYDALEDKYRQYIRQQGGCAIYGFVCYHNKQPIGYIQYYSIKRHQWLDVDLSFYLDHAAGIDVFIGEKDKIGQGLGKKIIERFLSRRVFREFDYCFVDPQEGNHLAIACYKKCGFMHFGYAYSDDNQRHELFIKAKSSLKYLMNRKRDQTKPQNTGDEKNFIRKYITDPYLNRWNKTKNHSAKARKAT
jgi:aminoglycoside 6'-N-acetyltransferase